MLMKDPKKSITTILAGMAPKMSEAVQSDEAEYDPSMGYKTAAKEILSAIESKDESALVEALKSFHQMCQDEPEEEMSESAEPAE